MASETRGFPCARYKGQTACSVVLEVAAEKDCKCGCLDDLNSERSM